MTVGHRPELLECRMRRIPEAFTKVSTHVVSLWFEDVGIAQRTYGKLPVETIGT